MNNPGESAPADLPAWLSRGRIPSLDGVRAIAILLVLYAHADIPGHSAFLLALPVLSSVPCTWSSLKDRDGTRSRRCP